MQLIVLGGDIYLRRRLEPADFGLYAIVQFALAIFMGRTWGSPAP